jgi:outer membrane immunogenic protein
MLRTIWLGPAMAALLGAAAGHGAKADSLPAAPAYNAPILAFAAPYRWNGFYLGVNAGGSWGRSGANVVFDQPSHSGVIETALGSASQTRTGALGGLQAGYNFQTSALVLGLEADFQPTGQHSDALLPDTVVVHHLCIAPCVAPPPTVTTGTLDYARRLPWFGTLRGRVGVTPTDRWLIYATGGLGFSEIRTDATFTAPGGAACIAPCTPTAAGSTGGGSGQIRAGWVIGGGVEAALGGGWSGKLEYLHMDLGSVSSAFASATAPFVGTFRTSSRVTDDIVRIGVNYRFGDPAGAKY